MEEILKMILQLIEEKAYIPGNWYGVSESKVVNLDDVKRIIKEYMKSGFETNKLCLWKE